MWIEFTVTVASPPSISPVTTALALAKIDAERVIDTE
jgi:hypothetical protein